MKNITQKIKYEAPSAVILTPSDELLDRQSLNIDEGNGDDLDIEFDYDDFWTNP